MKSILHLKDDTEYQIPLREAEKGDRAKVKITVPNSEAEKAANEEKVNNEKEAKQDHFEEKE